MGVVGEGERRAWAPRGGRRGRGACSRGGPKPSELGAGPGERGTARLPSVRGLVRPVLPPLAIGNITKHLPPISSLPPPPWLPLGPESEVQGPQLPGDRSYLP